MFQSFRQVSSKFGSFAHANVFSSRTAASGNLRNAVIVGAVGSTMALYWYHTTTQAHAAEHKAALDSKEFKPVNDHETVTDMQFTLKSIEPINHNTKLFRFYLGGADLEPGLTVASCLLTKAPIGEGGKAVIRPYTPGYMDLIVKEYPQGVMSKHIHSLKPGDTLEMKGPISKIAYRPNMKKKIGMIAGGSGITPMLQVTREILKNPADKTDVTLIFANIAEEDILLRKEFDEMAKKHSNFHVYYVLEKPPKNWTQGVGWVTSKVVKEQLPPPSADHLIMVCGPPGMMKAVSGDKAPDYSQGELDGILKNLGYTSNMVFKF